MVNFSNCPIVWCSKHQTTISLSTTEAEIQVLSLALRDVKFLLNLLNEIKVMTNMNHHFPTTISCRTFEDNQAAVDISNEPKLRPRTKHLAVQLFQFREHVINKTITIEHVMSEHQAADVFTKPLAKRQFETCRHNIMGW